MGDSEEHSAQLLRDAFGDKSIYEILEVDKNANDDQVKKAYRKLALKYHPDKGGDAKLFQALSLAHSILSDPEKRKIYDQTGELDGDSTSQDFTFWYEYFRGLFPKISTSDIDKFSEKYIGSEEEKTDVISAYNKHNGDLKKIMATVILAEDGEEARICSVIDVAIEEGLLKSCKKYTALRVTSSSSNSSSSGKGSAASNKKRKKESKQQDEADSLAQLIQSRNTARGGGGAGSAASRLSSIYEKYGGGSGKYDESEYDIPDDEFAALQKKYTSTASATGSKSKSSKKK